MAVADTSDRSEAVRLLRALAESSPAMLWISDPGGALTFVSRRWQECTGQSQEKALGSGWLSLLHPEDGPTVQEMFLAAHERREPFSVDCRLRHADGEHRWVLTAGRPHLGTGSVFLGFAGTVIDIHDRKVAERALRHTQQLARFLANASVALTDLSDFRSILQRLASLAVPFFADWCAVDLVLDDGSLERLMVVHSQPHKAGLAHEITRRWLPQAEDQAGPGKVIRTGQAEMVEDVDASSQPWVRDEDHRRVLQELGMASYLCVPIRWGLKTRAALTLVTAPRQRRYESDDLRVAEDLAQRTSIAIENALLYRTSLEADRRKDEFLAVLSHELRTPLNAIVGWAHVLRSAEPSPETLRKGVEAIHRNAQIQTQLIADILDISRIVAGKLRLDVRSVELPAVVEAALDTLKAAAQAKHVRIETVLDPRAGPISGDAGRLQQIVSNLVSNAVKFVPEKTGRVQIRLEAINSHVRLTVEDNGPGVDPAFLPHIFERFRQADSSSNRSHQGLGLGLAIVRELVELQGGRVRAENREGRSGAIFTVELPRRSVAMGVVAPEGAERHPYVEEPVWLDAAPALEGLRLVVVDDQEDAREMLKAVLERCGATVIVAASAAEALAKVRALKPDLVLADIEMPGQSGYDFLRELRSLPPEAGGLTPTVALTAYATAHDRVKALRAGFQMHVIKPVQPAELAAVVATLTGRSGY